MRHFTVILKPAGAACNLRCGYCFFRRKAALYPGSAFRMDGEVLEACLREVLAAHPGPEVNLTWQGGEPTLMGRPFFERAVATAERLRKPSQRVRHAFQTNGLLVDDDWARFFRDNNFLVGLSIDGPEAVHDRWRVDAAGRGSHGRAVAAWRTMAARDVEVNAMCSVHRANVDRPLAVYRFLTRELGAQVLQFIPIVEPAADGSVSARSLLPGQFARFLGAVFDEWASRDVGRIFVQSFDSTLASWVGQPSLCAHAPECGDALVIEHNGDVYACDHFVDPAHRLGNVTTDPFASMLEANAAAFGSAKRSRLPDACLECDVAFACQGECPRNRFVPSGDPARPLNYLCADYRRFFHHVGPAMTLMARQLDMRRPPSEAAPAITRQLAAVAAAAAAAGRNDPCPCGSGLKVKRCHGEVARG